jgi:hypothetical protein
VACSLPAGAKNIPAPWGIAQASDREVRGLERKLINCANVFTHVVDAVATAQRSVVVSEDVPRKADPRTHAGGVIILVGRIVPGPGQASDIKLAGATAIHERILSAVAQFRIKIADVAFVVVESAEDLRPHTNIQRYVGTHLPVILNEEPVVVVAILMVIDAASTKAPGRRSFKESLEIPEKELPVEDLRK